MIEMKRAQPKDFLEIAALDRDAWRQNGNSEFIPDGEHAWRIWVEHALVFVALDAERIVGAALAFKCLTEDFCLHKVFIDPSARGKKIGSLLFGKLLGELDRDEKACFLTVDPTNEAALKLYASWGFTDRTFVKGYYRENEDRFVLRRFPKKIE